MPVVSGLELARFSAAHPRLADTYLRRQEALGCVRPEWRFALLDRAGAVRGRAVYWGLPGGDRPFLLDVILADDEPTAAELLADSLRLLRIDAIDYQPTRAIGADRGDDEPRALEANGFALVAIQQRLLHTGPLPEVPVVAGVLPVRTDGGPVIGDIGVVPLARGRGIGRLLLAHGTAAVLGETGRVGADVDDHNAAMLSAATAVGYRATGARAHYRRDPGPTGAF